MDAIRNILQATHGAPRLNQGSPTPRAAQTPSPDGEERRAEREASPEELKAAADKVSTHLARNATRVTFTVDKDLGRVVVRVINPETRELVRQIPPQELLDLAHQLDSMDTPAGLLADEVA